MRKIDKLKSTINEKAAKTINFDKLVLIKIEERSKQIGITASQMVNFLCRQIILKDVEFHKEMRKYYYMKMQESDYMIQQAEAICIVESSEIKKQEVF